MFLSEVLAQSLARKHPILNRFDRLMLLRGRRMSLLPLTAENAVKGVTC